MIRNIKFLKRRLGSSLSQPFGIIFGILGIGMIIHGVNIVGIFFFSILILIGIVFTFGKEITEIDLDKKYIRQYLQVLFLKSGPIKQLPTIKYILIRDFNTKISYSTMSDDAEYYEISIITENEIKIVIAFYQNKNRAIKLMSKLKSFLDVRFVDSTKGKILKM